MQNRYWNPLAACPQSARHSSYLRATPDGVAGALDAGRPIDPEEAHAHALLTDRVLDKAFPCVAARSALNRREYRFGLYPALDDERSARAVCHDLYEFSHEFARPGDRFVTFVAAFRPPHPAGEQQFEQALWQHLQRLHEIDAANFGWSDAVSSDPDSPQFSFSIGGRAFFVVGLHAHASRLARRTPWPMLAFNLHEQFERLRTGGRFDALQRAIRARDLAGQGSINPMLSDFGDRSETRQYSGRAVPDDWRCPFRPTVRERRDIERRGIERRSSQRRALPRGALSTGEAERRLQQRRLESPR